MNAGQWVCLIVFLCGEFVHWKNSNEKEINKMSPTEVFLLMGNYKLHMICYAIMFLAFTIMKVAGK